MTDTVDPNDFVITRRRKKYKFAKFLNAENCYELAEWCATQNSAQVDVVEVGAGTGLFSVELASRYPRKTFVAIDVKADRLQKGAYEALARKLTNVYFVRARADQMQELFIEHSLTAVWLTFPDPFPRARSAGRRLTHPRYLERYARLLKKSGALYIKHDNLSFFHWSLEQLVSQQWHIKQLSFDLHKSDLSDDYKLLTTYEKRWLAEGLVTNFVQAKI